MRVYYAHPDHFDALALYRGQHPAPVVLEQTHLFVTNVDAQSCDDAFCKMQGENWSPHGEARPLIARLGVRHTSMSVGDLLVDDEQRRWLVAPAGFIEV